MIPLAIPNLAGNEEKYLQECVKSTFVSTVGPFVSRFESMVSDASGSKYCVATSAGTTALHVGLVALNVEPGDLVICPSLTFIATANAIAHAGAIPWLMDCDQNSWTISPETIALNLQKNTYKTPEGLFHKDSQRKVAAILPVFTMGCPADMNKISDIANEFGLPIIVDAAAALGSTYKGKKSGSTNALLTMYSFNGNKTVTCGGGGAIVGEDEDLLAKIRHLTTTARSGQNYDHDMVGYNYRLTNIQAAVGCAQMENLENFVGSKRKIATKYNNELVNYESVLPFPSPDFAESSCWFSGVYLPNFSVEDINEIHISLRNSGIDSRPFWKPVHMQKPYLSSPKSPMPQTEKIWQKIITLPCSTHLTKKEQEFVINTMNELLKNYDQ